MNEIKIEYLWRWFIANEQQIIDAINNVSDPDFVVENLDNLVLSLGVFTWEIGSGKSKPWTFTISPNGDRELLGVSQKIMSHAPELDNWEFNYCKPAKDWDRKFLIYDGNMDQHALDASNWNYAALRSKNGMIELILEAENINHLDDETADTAADLVVTGEIGEETRINKIASVDIVDQLDPEYGAKKTHIQHLRDHLRSL